MECVKDPGCNCEKGCKIPDTHECCTQKGNEGRLGIPVKKGFCDKSRGLPVKGCKDPNNKYVGLESYENFAIVTKEGYDKDDCDCSDWNHAFMILFIIIVILVFLIVSWYLSSMKIRRT